jgi:hypothetical protein
MKQVIPLELSADQIRLLRTGAQFLHHPAEKHPLVQTVKAMCGVNAQSTPAMMLSLRARIRGLEQQDIRKAIEKRKVVRAWTMRGTMHLIAAEDLRWLVATLGPSAIVKNRTRRAELGLSDTILEQGISLFSEILDSDKPLTRYQIAEKLLQAGLPIDTEGQVLIHLIQYASLKGLLCFGPELDNGESTFVLVERWLGREKPDSGKSDVEALVRRYIEGYGPASMDDFCAWSGLTKAEATPAWESVLDSTDIAEVQTEGQTLWLMRSNLKALDQSTSISPSVRLLPAFDAYILGYADRDLAISPEYRKQILHGGQIVPAVMGDGTAAGVWRYESRTLNTKIIVHAFYTLGDDINKSIAEEAEDIGRFMGKQVELSTA